MGKISNRKTLQLVRQKLYVFLPYRLGHFKYYSLTLNYISSFQMTTVIASQIFHYHHKSPYIQNSIIAFSPLLARPDLLYANALLLHRGCKNNIYRPIFEINRARIETRAQLFLIKIFRETQSFQGHCINRNSSSNRLRRLVNLYAYHCLHILAALWPFLHSRTHCVLY